MWEYAVVLMIMVVVGYWIFYPLLRESPLGSLTAKTREAREKSLLQRKEEIYEAIKEMDFDFGMGKISEEDYRNLKSQYRIRALEILKELDTQQRDEMEDTALEQEVHPVDAGEFVSQEGGSGKDRIRRINFCPQCGSKLFQECNFCPNCGERLKSP